MNDNSKTVKELQAELVELGFDEKAAKGIRTKDSLVATIAALQKKETETSEVKVDQTTPSEDKDTERSWQAKADKMAKQLHEQPKIRVLIPLEPKEKVGNVKEVEERGTIQYRHISGAVWSKTFNGYKVIIPKGVYYPVPEQIAENISTELNQTQQAGQHLKLDRVDPNTGKPVRNQLS